MLFQEREDYIFSCNRWLATGEDDGQICRELVPVNKFEFERRKSRRLTRKMSTSSSKGDTIDLEQKGEDFDIICLGMFVLDTSMDYTLRTKNIRLLKFGQ